MKTAATFLTLSFASVALAAPASARSALALNTPASATTCQPTLLTWSGGVSPYLITVQKPIDTHVLYFSDNTNSTSATWIVNAPAGTFVDAEVQDSTGAIGFSAGFEVVKGKSTKCTV